MMITACLIAAGLCPAAVSAAGRIVSLSDPTIAVGDFAAPLAMVGSLSIRDLGRDGVGEVIVGAGPEEPPMVAILRGDGSKISEFQAFDAGMRQGVNVAVGDFDGDGIAEIAAGAGPGAAPHVVIYSISGRMRLLAGGFFPYDRAFRGGVSLTVADADGDGRSELVTAPGPTGDGLVKVWKIAPGRVEEIGSFTAFDEDVEAGLSLAAADMNGDRREEIIAARSGVSDPVVRTFRLGSPAAMTAEFTAIGNGFRGGLELAAGDTDNDGRPEILAIPHRGGGPHLHVYSGSGWLEKTAFVLDERDRGGSVVAIGRTNVSADLSVYAIPASRDKGRPDLPRFIRVNIAEQKLYAYEFGRLTRSFLVSTGLKATPTPIGEFLITEKPLIVDYTGPGYDLGIVKWNLRFYPHIYIHYAPWHFNFGRRMSHGCVNVDKANAEWIYNWAEVGTAVVIEG